MKSFAQGSTRAAAQTNQFFFAGISNFCKKCEISAEIGSKVQSTYSYTLHTQTKPPFIKPPFGDTRLKRVQAHTMIIYTEAKINRKMAPNWPWKRSPGEPDTVMRCSLKTSPNAVP